MQGRPFSLLGVNSDKDLNHAKKAISEQNLTWRSWWNGPQGTGGPISAFYKVRSWPTIYVIDQNGVVRYKNVRGEALDKAIDQLVAELESDPALTVSYPVEGMGPVMRDWTDATGEFSTKASFEKFEDGKVTLRTDDGRELILEMAKLSKDDQEFVRNTLREAAKARRRS